MRSVLISLLFLALGCKQPSVDPSAPSETPSADAPAKAEGDFAVFSWDHQEHDFGTIGQESKVSHTFTFTNSGKVPLLISDAKGSCGCTVPVFPKDPIAPGASGDIKVSFDPAGRQGMNTKLVTILANSLSGSERVVIKANVKP